MKITDLKCAVIGNNPVVRITTDEGIGSASFQVVTVPRSNVILSGAKNLMVALRFFASGSE